MYEKKLILNEWVGYCLAIDGHQITTSLLKADLRAQVYLISCDDKPYAILKTTTDSYKDEGLILDQNRVERGYRALKYLESLKSKIVAPALLSDLLRLSDEMGGGMGYFQTVMPGYPLSHPLIKRISMNALNKFWCSLGQGLKGLHTVKNKRIGWINFNENCTLSHHQSWGDFFDLLWNSVFKEILLFQAFFPINCKELMSIYDRIKPLFFEKIDPVLCHGDIGHGNILLNLEGQFLAWVDWDESFWGDPHFDLSPVFCLGWMQADFLKGYGSFEISSLIKQKFYIYRLFKLMRFYTLVFTTQQRNSQPLFVSDRLNGELAQMINFLKDI